MMNDVEHFFIRIFSICISLSIRISCSFILKKLLSLCWLEELFIHSGHKSFIREIFSAYLYLSLHFFNLFFLCGAEVFTFD